MAKEENKQLDNLGNLDQVREIIFGTQTRVFEEEISKLESNMEKISSKLLDSIEALETTLRSEQASATQIVEQKVKNLLISTQDESSEFKEQLVKHEKKFNRSLEMMKDDIEVQIDTLKNEHNSTKSSTKKELNSLQEKLNDFVAQQIENLNDAKVSKDDFSAMLLDMAMKIKGTNIQDSLDHVIQEQEVSK
ncbi:MAG: hypothetical protein ABFR02_07925 [Campylobacterota bacterium]